MLRRITKMSRKLIFFVIALTFTTGFFFIRTSNAANAVAIWLLDEGKGEEIKDSSGNGHTGKFVGKPEWADGKIGKGVKFNGSTSHIEVDDPDQKLTPKHITMLAWVNLDNVAGTHAILEQYDWVASLGTYCLRTVDATVYFAPIWGVDSILAQGGDLKAGQWMHIAATYDGKDAKALVNGKIVATGTDAQKRDLIPSKKSLSIGVRGDTKDIHWMAGVLDEIAIYDEALSENDIQKIMNSGLSKILAVSSLDKLSATWGNIKTQN